MLIILKAQVTTNNPRKLVGDLISHDIIQHIDVNTTGLRVSFYAHIRSREDIDILDQLVDKYFKDVTIHSWVVDTSGALLNPVNLIKALHQSNLSTMPPLTS